MFDLSLQQLYLPLRSHDTCCSSGVNRFAPFVLRDFNLPLVKKNITSLLSGKWKVQKWPDH